MIRIRDGSIPILAVSFELTRRDSSFGEPTGAFLFSGHLRLSRPRIGRLHERTLVLSGCAAAGIRPGARTCARGVGSATVAAKASRTLNLGILDESLSVTREPEMSRRGCPAFITSFGLPDRACDTFISKVNDKAAVRDTLHLVEMEAFAVVPVSMSRERESNEESSSEARSLFLARGC